jgi:hypothetical protein
LIIILFSSSGKYLTNIAAFPEDIASSYFSSDFSFLITFDFTIIESPILQLKEEKMTLFCFKIYICNSSGIFEELINF